MVSDYFTVTELMEALDIYEISAKELLEGIIRFTDSELHALAEIKQISVDTLTR